MKEPRVNAVDDDDDTMDDYEEYVAWVAKPRAQREITAKSRCFKCGGLGHLSTFFVGKEKKVCPTVVTIPREILDDIIYPHIPSAKEDRKKNVGNKFKGKSSKEISAVSDSSEEEEEPIEPEVEMVNKDINMLTLASDSEDELFAEF